MKYFLPILILSCLAYVLWSFYTDLVVKKKPVDPIKLILAVPSGMVPLFIAINYFKMSMRKQGFRVLIGLLILAFAPRIMLSYEIVFSKYYLKVILPIWYFSSLGLIALQRKRYRLYNTKY